MKNLKDTVDLQQTCNKAKNLIELYTRYIRNDLGFTCRLHEQHTGKNNSKKILRVVIATYPFDLAKNLDEQVKRCIDEYKNLTSHKEVVKELVKVLKKNQEVSRRNLYFNQHMIDKMFTGPALDLMNRIVAAIKCDFEYTVNQNRELVPSYDWEIVIRNNGFYEKKLALAS